jgi:hypothetical protein
MILNAYAVLDAFLSVLRLGIGVLVLGLGLSAVWGWVRSARTGEARRALEDRCYLLFQLAGLLLVLNVLAWPVLYLLLQSYVPEWPGVMCIYGVTRIGAGSMGSSRFLPPLVSALQAMKPALVFLSGAWFVLYLVNRGTRTAPLTGRVLGVLLIAALLAVADAAAEAAYLAIPKKELFPSSGCCTEVFDADSGGGARFVPAALVGEGEGPRWYGVYYAVNLGMAAALAACLWFTRGTVPRGWLAALGLGAALSVAFNAVFLVEVAAPRLLRLPYHHCPYDLVPRAPESLVAVALFLAGSFAVGWACVVGWLGGGAESGPGLPQTVARLLRVALAGYLGSVVMLSVELILA